MVTFLTEILSFSLSQTHTHTHIHCMLVGGLLLSFGSRHTKHEPNIILKFNQKPCTIVHIFVADKYCNEGRFFE